ncbi:MAG: hypothetical protein K2Y05_10475 [Hyphomicrobiaceae bacterium]|nr:hypothetical protein [Hyphomicrobiaceae bacterium]
MMARGWLIAWVTAAVIAVGLTIEASIYLVVAGRSATLVGFQERVAIMHDDPFKIAILYGLPAAVIVLRIWKGGLR